MVISPYLEGALWALLFLSPCILATISARAIKRRRARRRNRPLITANTARDLGIKPSPKPAATKSPWITSQDKNWEAFHTPTYLRRNKQAANPRARRSKKTARNVRNPVLKEVV